MKHAPYYMMVEESRQMKIGNGSYWYRFVGARIWRIECNVIGRVYKYKCAWWSAKDLFINV